MNLDFNPMDMHPEMLPRLSPENTPWQRQVNTNVRLLIPLRKCPQQVIDI